MRFGLTMPNFGDFAEPDTIVPLAVAADKAGWDGFFIWDHINPFREEPVPVADPWVLLAAIAQATERILIGPMVTPVPRRRPWVLARQSATLDALSRGRLILGVGLGIPAETEFTAFGEEADLRIRAEKLDEALAILEGLWSGEPFEFSGRHYRVERTRFLPVPVQRPRIPVWVGGVWPNAGPIRRAARWDGYFTVKLEDGEDGALTPAEVGQARGRLDATGGGRRVELVVADEVVSEQPRYPARLRALAEAGATWHLDGLGTRYIGLDRIFDRVRQGPPRT